ncbi:ABC1 kinase family protein [Microbacterium immunditiarum]|uniref:Putative unusual protein kinase regulating ubiquinone biosynthesis (AarF/ABC1/UbiB family) n=1 Tax=Microbacterium immunditiarum TaxID=337480 RepID=A0A7Y9GMU3_9MICO|nr:AarF/UbiB family protein [Microbacterium immunditiarum]NYE19395.1 putative unusual protein kinase regulating ubiquinone biosynthesis (AarF/ABC1/UbiB family) [Microbacterium immunditiarum]
MADPGSARARYRRILWFAARTIAQTWWFELILPRIGFAESVARGRAARLQGIAQRFHALAVELGGLMIKVGQFMSSRLDVLPPEITKELAGLQDEVPPVEFGLIRELAEAELDIPLERAFAFVDPVPVAAASLGQAHRARLTDAEAEDTGFAEVVVKVQRPGIERIIEVDLAALRRVAGWLSRVRFVAAHVDPPRLIAEFTNVSLQEVDYLHEAQNAERFAEDFADDARVGVPIVAWERTTPRVLTLSDVTAIKVNDVEGLRAAGIDPTEVAHTFARVMFDQFFEHGYFHADPHPGNIFVTQTGSRPDGTPEWRLTFVDFGMMGEVPDDLRHNLQHVLIAVASRNGKQLVDSIRRVGVLLPSADTAELERAMTALFARFGGMGFAQLQRVDPREFREFGTEFSDVVRSLPFQLPENFLLIIRAVSLTSGMCSSLDPEFNMWDAVEPYAAKLLREEQGNIVQSFAREALSVAGITARLPRRADDLMTKVENGQLTVDLSRMETRMRRLERLARRVISAVLFASLLIAGAVLRAQDYSLGTVLIVASALPLLHALFAGLGRRS